MRFLAIGECMAELAPRMEPGAFSLGFAGDTFNTAWYVARIAPEIEVGYSTAIGDDALSNAMRVFIRDSRISDCHIQTIKGATVGLYLIHLSEGERSFSYWRSASAARQLACDPAALDAAIAAHDLIYVSGITFAILDHASRDNLLRALKKARMSGKTIAFDTNLRPKLWNETAEMITRTIEAASLADIVLPSFDDEADWFGDTDPRATLNRYAALGPARIIVKDSSRSVLFQSDGRQGEVAVESICDPVDTTAAGDSFNAGVLVGILRGQNLMSSIQDGCTLAGQVVRSRGALVPIIVAPSERRT